MDDVPQAFADNEVVKALPKGSFFVPPTQIAPSNSTRFEVQAACDQAEAEPTRPKKVGHVTCLVTPEGP